MGSSGNGSFYLSVGQFQSLLNIVWIADWGPFGVLCLESHSNQVFRKLTKLAIMAILASEALLHEKNPVAKCYPDLE